MSHFSQDLFWRWVRIPNLIRIIYGGTPVRVCSLTMLPSATTSPPWGFCSSTQPPCPVKLGTSPFCKISCAALFPDSPRTSGTVATGVLILMENPPGRTLFICTVMPVSDVNVCPTVSAVVVSSLIGGVTFCG